MYAISAFVVFLILMVMSVPVAVVLGFAAFVPGWMGAPVNPGQVVRTIVTAIDSFPLLAVPLFILAGEIMSRGGLARRLFALADALLGPMTGGLAIATVAACLMFGAISGSSPATVAAIGSMAIPLLINRGYGLRFSAGIVTAAGTLGVIIPPSIPMIIYGMSASVSVSQLFIGGILPGIFVAVVLMGYCWVHGWRHRDTITTEAGDKPLLQVLLSSVWALLAPVLVLGGIYSGVFTPTEAAALAVAYGVFVSMVIFREMTFKGLMETVSATALIIAPILIIAGTGAAFGRVLTLLGVPSALAEMTGNAVTDAILLLLLINLLLLLIGMFLETLSAIIVLTPMLLPIIAPYGIDPIHFGLIMVVNLAIGFITPPLGVNLYITSGVTGLNVIEVFKGVLIPLVLLLLALMVITYVPALTLLLGTFA